MKGIIADVNRTKAVLLTEDGQFITISNKNYTVGQKIVYNTPSYSKIATIAASFLLTLLLGSGLYGVSVTPISYVDMDINPSLRLEVNGFDRVINVQPLNADGEALVEQADGFSKEITTCMTEIITCCQDQGYIDEGNNTVEVHVVSKKDTLVDKACACMDALGQEVALVVSVEEEGKDIFEKAKALEVSIGRYKKLEAYTKANGGSIEENAVALDGKSNDEIENLLVAMHTEEQGDSAKSDVESPVDSVVMETQSPVSTVAPAESALPQSTKTPTSTKAPEQIPMSRPTKAPATGFVPKPTKTPVVAKTPEPTKTPVVVKTPEPTKTPVVVKTPEPTKTPVKTPAPVKTPEPTKTPVKTPAPVKTPEPTKTPVKTPAPVKTPEPTKTPVKTPAPVKTPEPTKTPVKTPEPIKTPEPTKTPEPVKTPEPTKTPEPIKTPEPVKTPEPTHTPKPPFGGDFPSWGDIFDWGDDFDWDDFFDFFESIYNGQIPVEYYQYYEEYSHS